ncbi:MAG: type II secretion system protein [Dehalococcoidia bacterium]|nr:MAG: type II secretion system protein [Dehalococcoidia bacterium]
MRLLRILGKFTGRESGVTFIETVVALAILGVIAVAFLNGLTTTSKSAFIADEQTTAESLAQSQIEWVKNASYSYNATTYSPAPIPSGKDYLNYSALITAEPLRDPDDGIQKITVTVKRSDKGVTKLEGYKVDR